MRCEVLKCRENEDGYCMASNYVTITADGECDLMTILTTQENVDTAQDNSEHC